MRYLFTTLILLVLCTPAHAVIFISAPAAAVGGTDNFGAIIQTKTAALQSTTITLTFDSTATSGNLLVLVNTSGAATCDTPTGWTMAVENNNGAQADNIQINYKLSDGTETDVVTLCGNDEQGALFYEIEGPWNASPLDKTAISGPQADTSAESGTTATTSQNDEVAIAGLMVRDGTERVVSWSNGFGDALAIAATYAKWGYAAFKLLSSTGEITTTATLSEVDIHIGAIATFKKE